jgi:hypothetical protein
MLVSKLVNLILVLAVFGAALVDFCHADTVVFSENMGNSPSTTSILSYTGWQNNGSLSFRGTGDVRNTAASNYSGASGQANVFLTNGSSRTFEIYGIDTSDFIAGTLDLTFGAVKSTTAGNMNSELILEFSTDGTNYSGLTFSSQPTGTGTAVWRSVSIADTILPISTSLFLRWTNTSSGTTQYRLDDVLLKGDLSAVPEPATTGFLLVFAVTGLAFRRRRV